jgi:copper chaperone
MKFGSLVVVLVLLFALSPAQEKKLDVVTLYVSGMHCDGCASNVSEALKGVKGVSTVKVSLDAKSAEIQFASGSSVSNDELLKAIANAGYKGSTTKPAADEPVAKKHGMKMKKGSSEKEGDCKDGCDKEKKKDAKKS